MALVGSSARPTWSDAPAIDGAGPELFGQGEWDVQRQGRARRAWRKLHLAVDAGIGEIVARVLTDDGADNAGEVPTLLQQLDGEVASVMADDACEGEPIYQAVTSLRPDRPPDVAIPPRASAVPSTGDGDAQSLRDRHVRLARRGGPHGSAGGDRLRAPQPRRGRGRTLQAFKARWQRAALRLNGMPESVTAQLQSGHPPQLPAAPCADAEPWCSLE